MGKRGLRVADGVAVLIVLGIGLFVILGPITDNPPPTRAQYVAKADKVCSDVEAKQSELDAKIFKGIPYDEAPPDRLWSEYARAILPTFDEQLDGLREITPPKGDEGKLRAYFMALEQHKAMWAKVAASPKNAKLLDNPTALETADELARRYGFFSCAHAED